jgi:hypothetical protein
MIVFVSLAHEDIPLVQRIVKSLPEGIELRMAERERDPGIPLREKVKRLIQESDACLVIWSVHSRKSVWVSNEIGYADGIGRRLVPFKQVGVEMEGFLQELEYVEFEPLSPDDGVQDVIGVLKELNQRGHLGESKTRLERPP